MVRLTGMLRVEVYEPGGVKRIVDADGVLTAPGILERPVPVRALIDREIAVETALHNILARKGYRDLDAVRAEGRDEGRDEATAKAREVLLARFTARGWTLSPGLQARLTACRDITVLMRWAMQSVDAADVEAALR